MQSKGGRSLGAAAETLGGAGHRSMPSPGDGPRRALLRQKSARGSEKAAIGKKLQREREREARSCD